LAPAAPAFNTVIFSADRRRFWAAGGGRKVQVFDAATGRPAAPPLPDLSLWGHSRFAVSRDERLVATMPAFRGGPREPALV
jgi:hypothetical protein